MSLIGRRSWRVSVVVTLVAFSAWSTALGGLSIAQPLELPLGLASGSGETQISDDGKQWNNLTPVSAPVFASTMIRTGKGLAWVALDDGTQQVELHECGIVGIYGTRAAKVVKIAVGRVLFRLPASSDTVLATPTVQFQIAVSTVAKRSAIHRVGGVPPTNSSDRMGWITVDVQGNSRVELLQGRILAKPVNGGGTQTVEPGQTAEFPVKENAKEDPDFKTLRENQLLCPCLTCAAWIPVVPVIVGTTFASLAVGTATAAGLAGVVAAIASTKGETVPIASPSVP